MAESKLSTDEVVYGKCLNTPFMNKSFLPRDMSISGRVELVDAIREHA